MKEKYPIFDGVRMNSRMCDYWGTSRPAIRKDAELYFRVSEIILKARKASLSIKNTFEFNVCLDKLFYNVKVWETGTPGRVDLKIKEMMPARAKLIFSFQSDLVTVWEEYNMSGEKITCNPELLNNILCKVETIITNGEI